MLHAGIELVVTDFFHLGVIGGAGVVWLCVAIVSRDNLGCGDRPPLSGPDGTVMCGRLVWVKGVSSALVRDRDRSCVRPVDAV